MIIGRQREEQRESWEVIKTIHRRGVGGFVRGAEV